MQFSLLRISAVEFSISQPLTNELMYRSAPGFIRRLLLHKVLLLERRARSVKVFLADSIVVVVTRAFMVEGAFTVAIEILTN